MSFDMRRNNIRVVICLVLGFLALRVMWALFRGYDRPTSEEMDQIIMNHRDPNVRGFKPSHCVYINGKCVTQLEHSLQESSKGLVTSEGKFYLDGQPFSILGGSFHYFRTHPGQWGDRLLKMRAAGLNTVTTYIPWNMHEQVKGEYNFTGLFDLPSFLQHVHQVGLKAIVRPGPYICSEWDWGGLPSWLLSDPNMVVRTSKYQPFLNYVKEYFNHLLPLLSRHQHKRKQGPIIAFQIENEFGSYGHDVDYLKFVKEQFEFHGLDEMYMTSDGPEQLPKGTLPGVLSTVNFKNNVAEKLRKAIQFQPNQPVLVMEYWAGWFDYWGYEHNAESPADFEKRVTYLLTHNASINFYMFEGGTNFAFWNGANLVGGKVEPYRPQITSYDYDSPLSEAGDITEKFHIVRNLIKKMQINGPHDIPDVPQDSPKAAYGSFKADAAMSYQNMISLIAQNKIQQHEDLRYMEYLDINNGGGQGYGWILYRHKDIKKNAQDLKIVGDMADRMQVIVNGLEEKTVELNEDQKQFNLRGAIQPQNTIDLLVENTGRINFKHLNGQRKGLQGSIYLDQIKLTKWQHVPFEFDAHLIGALSDADKSLWGKPLETKAPAVFKINFKLVGTPTDTFLDMQTWTKGIVIINKFNLGRYWNIGPAKTLYVPAPVLVNGINEVLVFELHQPGKEIVFLDKPILG